MKYNTKGNVNGSDIGSTPRGLSQLNSYTSQHIHNSAGYPKPTVRLLPQTHGILDSHGATSQGM
jgi:hypothetical protein